MKHKGFSLVEMLMALLVASLLMVALAPVMTKKFNEIVTISGLGERKYDPNLELVVFKNDDVFNIPNLVSRITVYMAGGGGAGGVARYGKQEFTAPNNTFTVPEGVTKLRVFMVGGGGAGGGGGVGTGTATGNVTGTASSTTITDSTKVLTWNIPTGAKGNVPNVDSRCSMSGNTVWKFISDPTKTITPKSTYLNVEACGGGGGGVGGSGGYVNKKVIIPPGRGSVSVTIGGGGGWGGGDDQANSSAGAGYGGGGGGCETSGYSLTYCNGNGNGTGGKGGVMVINCSSTGSNISGSNGSGTLGGGAAGAGCTAGSPCYVAAGAGTLQGGGGGGGAAHCGGGGGGGGATFFGSYADSTGADSSFFLVAPGGGGGGRLGSACAPGGGGGGAGGGAGASPQASTGVYGLPGLGGRADRKSPIGNENYCAGGQNDATAGKNGYMEISWGPESADIFQCEFNQAANGGAGGGGGQAWFGEIDVNPGDTLSITVGTGGSAVTSDYAKKGGNGGDTIIVHKKKVGGATTTYKVVGGEGGKYEESVTSLSSARGKGGGVGDSMFNWNTAEISDSDFAAITGGAYGGAGGSVASGAGGGKGGNTVDRHGEVVVGPSGGTSKSNGANATEYGTGGAGGGGLQDGETGFPGYGGNGAQGYVYIEWGGTNGGGGTAGEFVKKSINNLDNDDRALHITIGKGGDNSDPVGLGNGGVTTVSIKTGKGIVTQNAAGGMRGTDGGAQTVPTKVHGGETAPTWTIQDYKNFITPGMEAVVNGKAGSDDFGGIGGRLEFIYKALLEDGTSELQATVTATDGSGTVNSSLPGCGGASNGLQSDESDCNPSADGDNSPNGGDGRSAAGGGGGAVRGENAGKGGKGGDGFVILEYKSLGM